MLRALARCSCLTRSLEARKISLCGTGAVFFSAAATPSARRGDMPCTTRGSWNGLLSGLLSRQRLSCRSPRAAMRRISRIRQRRPGHKRRAQRSCRWRATIGSSPPTPAMRGAAPRGGSRRDRTPSRSACRASCRRRARPSRRCLVLAQFSPPRNPYSGGRCFLRFHAVDYLADVWLNDVPVGGHEEARRRLCWISRMWCASGHPTGSPSASSIPRRNRSTASCWPKRPTGTRRPRESLPEPRTTAVASRSRWRSLGPGRADRGCLRAAGLENRPGEDPGHRGQHRQITADAELHFATRRLATETVAR